MTPQNHTPLCVNRTTNLFLLVSEISMETWGVDGTLSKPGKTWSETCGDFLIENREYP